MARRALAAGLELSIKNDRISAARERVAAEKGHWGRPARLDGEKLAQAQVMRLAGRTVRQIAVALKVTKSSVGRALSRKGEAAETSGGLS